MNWVFVVFRPTDTVSATTVAEITKALAASIITNAKEKKKKSPINSLDNEVAVTMATAAAQRVAVSLSSPALLSNNNNNNNINNNNNNFVLSNQKRNKSRVDDEWKEVTRKYDCLPIIRYIISKKDI